VASIEPFAVQILAAKLSQGELAPAVATKEATDEDSSDASPPSDNFKRKML
jgi:hypothetical protein